MSGCSKLKNLKTILCLSDYFNWPEAQKALTSKVTPLGYNISYLNLNEDIPKEKLHHSMATCDLLIADGWHLTTYSPYLHQNIGWIHSTTAGVNLFMTDGPFLKFIEGRSDPPVMTRTSYTSAMVVYCMAYICSNETFAAHLRQQQKLKAWDRIPVQLITSRTVGILGVGDVGSGIAGACRALGMKCIGYSASTNHAQNFDAVYPGDLDRVLSESDYIVNSLPSTPQTINLLSNDKFKVCSKKSPPVFINVGRGTIIDEESVIAALDKGWISHAVLDVFETEPLPQSSPLWDHPKITVTPHISGGPLDEDTYPFVVESFMKNIESIQKGEKLHMVVDFAKGY